MTPPRLDVDACQEKLALLADLVADLDRHADVTGRELRADRDRRHVVDRLLPSVGMRNLLTHEYGRIDLDLVASAMPAARRDYSDYIEVVRRVLREPPSAR